MRLGIAKSEMGFPLVFALAFRYICSQSDMFEKTTAKSADSIIYPTNKIIENMDLTLNLNSR